MTAQPLERICEDFYDLGNEFAAWSGPLAAVAKTFGAVGCDLHVFEGGGADIVSCGLPRGVVEQYVAEFAHREPRSRFCATAAPGAVATDLEFTTADFMRTSAYYADFLRHWDLGHCIATVPVRNGALEVYLGIHYARGASAPPSAHLDRVRRQLTPHLARALRVQHRFRQVMSRSALCERTLDSLPFGIVVLDRHGRALIFNCRAETVLNDGQVLRLVASRLRTRDSRDQHSLDRLIAAAISRTNGQGGAHIASGEGGRRIAISVAALPSTVRALTGAAVLVSVTDLTDRATAHWSHYMRPAYGLTQAEGRLIDLLVEGLSAREVSDQLNITYETARTQIKDIYSKTGVSRHAQLVALAHAAFPNVRLGD